VVAGGVSLINKMLQDLDRRQALGAGAESRVVQPAAENPRHREWFWRVVTVLLVVGVAWVGWIAYQILPRPLVTNLAFRAAEEARARPAAPVIRIDVKPKPVEVVEATPAPAPVAVVPEPAAEKTPPAAESLKLAQVIETPLRPRPAPAPKATPAPPAATKASQGPPASAATGPAKKPTVDKRERTPTPTDAAETLFRRGALLLSHGRVAEAENALLAALRSDPAHGAARQAYVALLLEQKRMDAARRQLEEALAIDPAQPTLAVALARLLAGQREYRPALAVLDRAGAHDGNADFHLMRGAVLQRLGRDAEAIDAFQAAIRGGPQPGTTWVSLAISLEAAGRKAEAASAYRKALNAGPLAAEAREYAQARARALE
jgi:MSHA biogenesis protein MshN